MGKGGSGKSVLAGTTARLLARRGHRVLAVDSDPMPGLAFSVGVEVTDAPLPDDLVEETPEGDGGPPFRLRAGLTGAELVERHALAGPDGLRVLQFGKLRGHVAPFARSQVAFRRIIADLENSEWSLVGDLPGGTRQPFFGWGGYADTVLVVTEPSAKSMLAARRLARLAAAEHPPDSVVAVANKVRRPDDPAMIARRTGLEVMVSIPWDDAIARADRQGAPPVEVAPRSPAVQAVERLCALLEVDAARSGGQGIS